MKKRYIKYILVVIISVLAGYPLHAQQVTPLPDTVVIAQLAADLAISKPKARKLYVVLHHRLAGMDAAMAGPEITNAQRLLMVQNLGIMRKHKVDSLLTPAQRLLWDQHMAKQRKNDGLKAAREKEHEDQENQVPHTRTRANTTLTDTGKTIKH